VRGEGGRLALIRRRAYLVDHGVDQRIQTRGGRSYVATAGIAAWNSSACVYQMPTYHADDAAAGHTEEPTQPIRVVVDEDIDPPPIWT